ncbi:PqqD family protein [Kitasatospora azatica]|uniref:PqqD family protein n=1 Tax=Kitasatospora azatica TaxID=58347 RepID=UPI0012FA7AB9|nr:PqqD family protein [Kitasatospora azatica]
MSFVSEGDEVVVGRLDTGSYAVFPSDGAELLKRLTEGMPLDEAAAWYEETFDEPVDVEDFVATLHELGFVRESDGAPLTPAAPVRLRGLGRAAFSPVAWACYLAVLVAWLTAVAIHRELRPAPSQIFFVRSLLVVQLVITFGQVPLLLAHEGFHILAGRRLGLPTKLRLSNRLTYIVAETQTNGLMSVDRRKRYLPFLAGMVCDGVVLGTLGLIAAADRHGDGSFSLTGRLCLALAFTVVMRILWQFQLYLRTDLYYVFATALRCYDLHDASKALLKNRIWRLLRRPERQVDEGQWTEQDRRVGTFYGPFIVLGFCVLAAITIFASIPVTVSYFRIAAHAIGSGRVDARFWDSLLSLCLNAAQTVALVVLSRRKRREQRRAANPALS